ncbi:MAG: hypothetical protein OEW37_04600 [Rhodospirillaceae bacterium]|nr:hypothetical protein [Rhodospirillaceae bacterium]
MQKSQFPLTRFAIFRDSELIERANGGEKIAKARLEHFSNTTPDHNWWFVTYESDDELSAPATRRVKNEITVH